MANVNVSIADAGFIAGASGAAKPRTEPGAGRDKAGAGDEQQPEFGQFLAKGEQARTTDTDAKAETGEKSDEASPRLPTKPAGGPWMWPDGAPAVAGKSGGDAAEEGEERERQGLNAAPKAPIAPGAAVAQGNAPHMDGAEVLAPGSGPGKSQAARTDVAAAEGHADRSGEAVANGGGRTAAPSSEPLRGAPAASASMPETNSRTTPAARAEKVVSQGAPMQPGAAAPAAVQLAAVLARGREAPKRAEPSRTAAEAPAKIQVSLSETHFSPIKPDSDLEIYDLTRRMERGGQELGRSTRDSLRLQANVSRDFRSENRASSGQAQGDVRAELLSQNVARPVSGDLAGQIGTKILQELEQPRSSGETRNSGLVQVKQSDPVLKVLELRLEPRELGTVIVRMSLRNDVLNVELGFGKSDAAAAIAKSTDQLSNYLRSSGYNVDAIVVRVVADSDRAPAPVASSVSGVDASQGQTAPAQSASSSGLAGQSFSEQGERRPRAEGGQTSNQNGEGSHAQDNSQPRPGGGLFV